MWGAGLEEAETESRKAGALREAIHTPLNRRSGHAWPTAESDQARPEGKYDCVAGIVSLTERRGVQRQTGQTEDGGAGVERCIGNFRRCIEVWGRAEATGR